MSERVLHWLKMVAFWALAAVGLYVMLTVASALLGAYGLEPVFAIKAVVVAGLGLFWSIRRASRV